MLCQSENLMFLNLYVDHESEIAPTCQIELFNPYCDSLQIISVYLIVMKCLLPQVEGAFMHDCC